MTTMFFLFGNARLFLRKSISHIGIVDFHIAIWRLPHESVDTNSCLFLPLVNICFEGRAMLAATFTRGLLFEIISKCPLLLN